MRPVPWRDALRAAFARAGYDVHRRDLAHPARRAAAMRARGVDLVLDVGANAGQYAATLRATGYRGRIVSFEPIPAVFAELCGRFAADPRWSGRGVAVGAGAGTATLNVSDSSVLSSLLPARAELSSRLAEARVHERVEVDVVGLDDVWDEVVPPGARVLVKIDVQGYEHPVLDGLAGHLSDVALLEVEMGLETLYEGGSTLYSLLPRLERAGLHVVSIDDGFVDAATGQVLDIDLLAGR